MPWHREAISLSWFHCIYQESIVIVVVFIWITLGAFDKEPWRDKYNSSRGAILSYLKTFCRQETIVRFTFWYYHWSGLVINQSRRYMISIACIKRQITLIHMNSYHFYGFHEKDTPPQFIHNLLWLFEANQTQLQPYQTKVKFNYNFTQRKKGGSKSNLKNDDAVNYLAFEFRHNNKKLCTLIE